MSITSFTHELAPKTFLCSIRYSIKCFLTLKILKLILCFTRSEVINVMSAAVIEKKSRITNQRNKSKSSRHAHLFIGCSSCYQSSGGHQSTHHGGVYLISQATHHLLYDLNYEILKNWNTRKEDCGMYWFSQAMVGLNHTVCLRKNYPLGLV